MRDDRHIPRGDQLPVVLITGGAGFIGSCFVRQTIAESQFKAVVLDKLTYAGNLDSLAEVAGSRRYVFQQGAIEDTALVGRLLDKYRPQAILNFAAESHVDRSIDRPSDFVTTNVVGTCSLLDAALGYWSTLDRGRRAAFRFLQISTDEVYGSLGPTGKFSEVSCYAPNSPYSASKASADHFVRAYHRTYGLPTLITTSSNNFGPYQFPEKLVPLMILNALAGNPLPLYGDGRQIRDWIYVHDHCDAIWTVLKMGQVGETYNIGANSERTNLAIVESICGLVEQLAANLPCTPVSSLIQFVEDRPGHDRRYATDASKLSSELGWTPKYDFDSALRTTVQWYLDHETWTQRVSDGSYAKQRLGKGER